ncbi:MAG TPA: DUF4345 family protein [Baekduia sp.]|nr:DUF4345 family protein [Baekduia sp.]
MQRLAPSRSAAGAPVLRVGLLAVAVVQLATGLWLAIAPGSFYDAIADFGPRNEHDLRDMAAFYLASAIVLAVAARRPSWRAPALALVGLQFALHAVNHLVDIADADPSWVGPFDLVSLLAGTALILALYRSADGADAQAGR